MIILPANKQTNKQEEEVYFDSISEEIAPNSWTLLLVTRVKPEPPPHDGSMVEGTKHPLQVHIPVTYFLLVDPFFRSSPTTQ